MRFRRALLLVLGAVALQLASLYWLRLGAVPAEAPPVAQSGASEDFYDNGSASLPRWPFVSTNGTRLYRFGEPYRFVGANLWYGMHLGAERAAGGDRPRLLRELDRLQSLGVSNVRVLAASEGPDRESWFALGAPTPWRILPSMQPSPGAYNEAVVAGLDFLLSEMAKRDMTAVLMLGNEWPWSGGFSQYVSWAGGGRIPYPPPAVGGSWDGYQQYAKEFFVRPEAQKLYAAHVRYVLQRVNSVTGVAYR